MAAPPPDETVARSAATTISVGDTLGGYVRGTLYHIDEHLGAGGMGAVYRVTQQDTGGVFALKVLHRSHTGSDSARKRFEREARALSVLEHPNVVRIVDYGSADDGPFLVMELLEGQCLDERLLEGDLAATELRRYGHELLSALAYVHREGLVHRDLKPGNVFLHRPPGGPDQVKVLDFGLVKFVDGDRSAAAATLTRTGDIFGTPAYMAPEQIGDGKMSARTDIYSLGALLFEMVTRRTPFEGEVTDMLRGHLAEDPPGVAQACAHLRVQPALEALISRALRKSAQERFADAGEMLAAFDALSDPLVEPRGADVTVDALAVTTRDANAAATRDASAQPAHPPPTRPAASPRRAASAPRGRLGALWARLVTLSAFALIGASLVVIAASALVIYAMRSGRSEVMGGDPAVIAETLKQQVDGTRRRLRETGSALERGLDELKRAPAGIDEAVPAAPEPEALQPVESIEHGLGEARTPSKNPWRRALPPRLRPIVKVARAGKPGTEDAIRALRAHNREHTQDGRGHLLLAALYFNRGWRDDSLAQYEIAARIDPSLRGAPEMLPNLLDLAARAKTARRAADVVAAVYGPEARSALDRALRAAEDPEQIAALRNLQQRIAAPAFGN